jgi:hypothetical protein
MTAMRVGVLVVLAIVSLRGPLAAQERQLTLGQWVRVVSSADTTVRKGRLILVVADTVVLDDGHRIPTWFDYIPLDGTVRLELPRRTRSHLVAGALLGAGVGMALGVISYRANAMLSCAGLDCGSPTGQLIGQTGRVVVGGFVGAALGAYIGLHVYTSVWDPVPRDQVDRLRVGLAPRPGLRLGIGGSLAF